MTIFTAAGSKLYIGGVNNSRTNELADYLADSYVEVGELEDMGEYGDESTDVPFTSLSDSRTRHLKGARDAGTMPLVVGDDITDEGQIAMDAAEGTAHSYNFKVVLNDAITLGGEGTTEYFTGKVMSKRRNVGTANNVVRRNFAVGIQTAIETVPAS